MNVVVNPIPFTIKVVLGTEVTTFPFAELVQRFLYPWKVVVEHANVDVVCPRNQRLLPHRTQQRSLRDPVRNVVEFKQRRNVRQQVHHGISAVQRPNNARRDVARQR